MTETEKLMGRDKDGEIKIIGNQWGLKALAENLPCAKQPQ